MWASKENHLQILIALLEYGADVNAQTEVFYFLLFLSLFCPQLISHDVSPTEWHHGIALGDLLGTSGDSSTLNSLGS
jgi:ankyrin repeat protein